jgi:hypothetical protein
MDNSGSGNGTQGASPGLTELLGRSLTDAEFRDLLYSDREAAVREYQLTETDLQALRNLDREALDEHARQFAEGSATEITIAIVIRIRF